MANEDGIYREVDQELEEEKQLRQLKESAPFLIGIAVATVLGVAGWQFWSSQRADARAENAAVFSEALSVEEPELAMERLSAVATDAPAGYAALARLRLAGIEAGEEDTSEAISALSQVSSNDAVPERLRQLARVKAAYLALEASPDAAMVQLNGLQDGVSPIAGYAKEVAGLAALEKDDYASAVRYFEAIATIEGAPQPLRDRAESFAGLARLGADGVSLEAQGPGNALESLLDMPMGEGGQTPSPASDEQSPADEQSPGDAADEAAQELETGAETSGATGEEAEASEAPQPVDNDSQEGGTSGN